MLAKQMAQIATSLNELRGNEGRIPAAPEAPGRENANAVTMMPKLYPYPKDKESNAPEAEREDVQWSKGSDLRGDAEYKGVETQESRPILINEKLPRKTSPDPGVFTLPISIGEVKIESAMCDLEGIQLKKADITFQLADKTTVTPEGVTEDVIIKVGDASYPADFHVLNMGKPESAGPSRVLLGRPILNTAKTLIEVPAGVICLDYLGERLMFQIDGAMKRPMEVEILHTVSMSRPLGHDHSLKEEQGGTRAKGIEQEMADWWEDMGAHGLTNEGILEAILEFCQKPDSSWPRKIWQTLPAGIGRETEKFNEGRRRP